MSRTTAITSALLLAVLLAACGSGAGQRTPAPQPSPGALRVGVTLPVFADFVREVAGDRADVFSILPPGADPHTYEPTPSDIESIASADIIIVNNTKPGVEGSILDVIEANKPSYARTLPLMDNVPSPRADELGNPETTAAEAGDNPHLWLDPTLAFAYASAIADALVVQDSFNAAYYYSNLEDYGRRLSQLSDDIAATVEEIPPDDRKLVTVHDAFAHLARRYGLEIVGFLVGGADEDPSPREIADLTKAIENQSVPAVFGEPQIGPQTRLLEQIADDTGVEVCTLYSDTLDDRLPTYIDMMRFNADELLRCLGDQGG
ncbi:MAG: hypothetical protein A2148_04745 [Chloroflexi bacterium RBG_16_68_14]|nr:MAG: hypothetical protein A2148_04745 [Chloroflexi bacterium RBG_16_68_14]